MYFPDILWNEEFQNVVKFSKSLVSTFIYITKCEFHRYLPELPKLSNGKPFIKGSLDRLQP